MAKTQWVLQEIFRTGNREQRREQFQRLFGRYITDIISRQESASSNG